MRRPSVIRHISDQRTAGLTKTPDQCGSLHKKNIFFFFLQTYIYFYENIKTYIKVYISVLILLIL